MHSFVNNDGKLTQYESKLMPPSSPLTLDVPQVDPTRFRGQSDISIFWVLENEGRNNCKMLLKMGFQWMHKCVKWWQIVKRIMKKRGPGNLHMEMTKQGQTQALQSLIFEYFLHRIAVSTFPHLLRMCSKWRPKPFEIEACGCLWRQKLVGERFKNHTINKHQKSKKICQKCTPKRYSGTWSFCSFSVSGAKGVPGWSQRPPQPLTRSNFGENCKKMGARNCISFMFY